MSREIMTGILNIRASHPLWVTEDHEAQYPPNISELIGTTMIPIESYEPEAFSYRVRYYYNSVTNTLFQKMQGANGWFWKVVGG